MSMGGQHAAGLYASTQTRAGRFSQKTIHDSNFFFFFLMDTALVLRSCGQEPSGKAAPLA